MVNNRNVFKMQLIDDRKRFTKQGVVPVCPFCDKGIVDDGPDLHEAIISRGESRGNRRLQEIIMEADWNCVLVHHSEHIDEGDTKENDDKAILQLLELVGYERIIWNLNELRPLVKGRLIDDKIRRVNRLHGGA